MKAPASLPLTLRLRVPVFPPGTISSAKIEQLEEYLLVAAYRVGEMHEERAGLALALQEADEEWAAIDGYHGLMRSKTELAVEAAKADLNPVLAKQRRWLRHWIKQLDLEIHRLDREYDKVSRAYTMITGS
jgi:hypothetical protein